MTSAPHIVESKKILKGAEAIRAYLRGVSKSTFQALVKSGLPVRFEFNQYWAHADNLDTFMQKFTFVRMSGVDLPEEAQEDEKISCQ